MSKEILSIKGNYVKLWWPLYYWESYGDVENVLYYALDDGKLGEYSYCLVK